jgi:glycosyltransferase involved in cell wall biosynthesis
MPLFFSDPSTGLNRQPLTAGKAHYSYAFPCQRIVGLFRTAKPIHLPRPEIISTDIARRALGIGASALTAHLIFRPFDHIRVLKGAFNIAHIPWEFNHLIDEAPERSPHPFYSQRTMLRTCNEIWTGSRHAAAVYQEHGVESVKVIPSPVTCPESLSPPGKRRALLSHFGHLPSVTLGISFGINNVDRHQRAIRPLADQPALSEPDRLRVYLAIFNPGDFRKNAEKILRGFAAFAADHPEAVLLVKLVIDNERPTLATVQQNTLLPKFRETTTVHSPNVIFISPFLDEGGMSQLYRLADHYICLSIGEGQNLPLCEAMAQGVIPISVAHTAMADYIDPSVALVVPSARKMVLQPEASHYTVDGYVDAFDCTDADYIDALESSLALDAKEIARMRLAAHRRARDFFSPTAVTHAILDQSGFDFRWYV